MKVIRVICNVLIGIVLFALIFALTFIRTTKNFLEKDVILGVVKEKIVDTLQDGSEKITDKSKDLIDDMLKDSESNNIIRMLFDNYENYQDNKGNFKVSDKDVEIIYSYAMKYKSTIIEISGNKVKDITDEEFKKLFSSENINEVANEVFGSIDKDLGDGIDVAIEVYNKATSKKMMIAAIAGIVFFISLLLLINWSLYRWMLTTGVALIASGVLISLIFVAGLFFNDIITSIDIIKDSIGEIELTNYIIWGSFEIVLGIILIILYHVFNSKKKKESYPYPNNLVNNTPVVSQNENNETVDNNQQITQ